MDPFKFRDEDLVFECTCGRDTGFSSPIAAGGGDATSKVLVQYGADVLDPETILVGIDVADHDRAGRSSSAHGLS